MARSGPSGLTRPTQLVSWMSSPSPRLVRTTGFCMTPRGASAFSPSRMRMLSSSFARFGLCSLARRASGIPYLNTYDGRTIRYPDPIIKANDTIKIDLETNKIVNFIKFDEWFESLCYLKHTILIVICVQQTQGRSKIHKLKACSIR